MDWAMLLAKTARSRSLWLAVLGLLLLTLLATGCFRLRPERTPTIATATPTVRVAPAMTPTPSPATKATETPRPGQVVTTYTVQPNDNLWDIAQRYGTTVDAIAKANNIADPTMIQPDQQLIIPSGQ
ncbi:MAG: LysM peptidoglycan-binding domain-containing protein [Chloroflexi bacterium]|nr:LysM peptidoglycan-binding domain-containing protein [Chloroflexota bacterium]